MKTNLATANRARTNFSPSPIHLLVREDADIEKNVLLLWLAIHFPISVLPVPKERGQGQQVLSGVVSYGHSGVKLLFDGES